MRRRKSIVYLFCFYLLFIVSCKADKEKISAQLNEISTENDTEAITKTEDLYKTILEKYREAILQHWDMSTLSEAGLCYLFGYEMDIPLSEVGYAFIDLDNNGVQELIIGVIYLSEYGYGFDKGMLYDLYTITEGQITQIISSGERDRYYICSDLGIANESSGSAALSEYSYYTIGADGHSLSLVEAIIFDGFKDENNPWFYSATGFSEEDYIPISEDEAFEYIHSFEEKYMEIPFIPFSEL